MKQAELNRAVARATGETVSTIRRLGFLIADPAEDLNSELADLGPHVVDWDALEIQRLEGKTGRPTCEPAV